MSLRTSACVLLALMGTPSFAWAETATPDGASTLKGQLERYLGRGPVSVAPVGDGYKIDVDVKAALSAISHAFGFTLDPATYTTTATPQQDGTWKVSTDSMPPFKVKTPAQTISVAIRNPKFDSIFDPRIPAVVKSAGSYDSLDVGGIADSQAAKTGKADKKVEVVQTRRFEHGTQTSNATTNGDGIIDGQVSQSNETISTDMVIDAPDGARHFTAKGGPSSSSATFQKLQIRALFDVWAFLVAHPSQAELKANSAAFKDKLRAFLPAFDHWTQESSIGKLSIDTPVGAFSTGAVSGQFDVTGASEAGALNVALKAADVVSPTSALPAWTPPVIPTAIDLRLGAKGIRLDRVVPAVIDKLDVGAEKPFDQIAPDELLQLADPAAVVVSIGDSHIVTPTLDAHVSGEVRFASAIPSFKATIRAAGVDKAMAAIRAKAPKDPGATQAVTMLALVKGYGKAEPDGTVTWLLEGDGTGAITVNGAPLPVGGDK